MALEFQYTGKTTVADLQGWSTRYAGLLRVLLIEDADTTYRELKKHSLLVESMELATTYVVNGIRAEFAALRDTILLAMGS
jgi:hypothetical protein